MEVYFIQIICRKFKYSSKKFDRLVNLIKYLISSSDKIIKFVNMN